MEWDDKEHEGFVHGYLCACQLLAVYFGEPSVAKSILQESNIPKEEFLAAQQERDIYNETMIPLIKSL